MPSNARCVQRASTRTRNTSTPVGGVSRTGKIAIRSRALGGRGLVNTSYRPRNCGRRAISNPVAGFQHSEEGDASRKRAPVIAGLIGGGMERGGEGGGDGGNERHESRDAVWIN